MSRNFIYSIITVIAFTAISGCIKMGPDYQKPDMSFEIPDSFQHKHVEDTGEKAEEKWWHSFGDPELNKIVQDVLENNYDIKKAAARILEVKSRFKQTRADRLPGIGVQGSGQRQKISIQNQNIPSFGDFEIPREYDTYNLSFPASFELDLWGRLSRAEEAARAELLEAEESYLTIAQTLVAESINLYLLIESLERRIQVSKMSIKNFRDSLSIVESRYKKGLTSILDLRQARRTLAQAEAILPAFRQELGVAQQKLAVLLGRFPETKVARKQPENYFKLMTPVPPGLPSELLLRRPDIRAAEAKLKALNAGIGFSKASRFPSITLTGIFGYSSAELDQLLTPESELWSIAMGIVQPIFDAGKLKAGQRAAEARYQQGLAEYSKMVLTAFAEVEAALLTRKEQLERRDRILNFLNEARITQEVAESRYERGLLDYLTVLEAQQTRFKAEENLIMVDLAILSNRVNLHRALGSGLWKFEQNINPKEKKFCGF